MTHHLLVLENINVLCSTEQVEKMKEGIFPCGKCSLSDVQVYHNVIGRHRHHVDVREIVRLCESSHNSTFANSPIQ